MTALEDTRPIVSTTTASTNPSVIGEDLAHLLVEHPELELASIRLIREDQGVHIAGRVGQLAQPVCDCYPGGFSPETYEGPQHHCPVHGHGPNCCSSCHAHDDHPHTEYCQQRPADDPLDEITCDGRNCGGRPHA